MNTHCRVEVELDNYYYRQEVLEDEAKQEESVLDLFFKQKGVDSELLLTEALTEQRDTMPQMLDAINAGDNWLLGSIVSQAFTEYLEATEGFWHDKL